VTTKLTSSYNYREIETLINSIENPKHRLVLMVAYGCGLTLNEIRLLKVEDVDLKRKQVFINKCGRSSNEKIIHLEPVITNAFKSYIKYWNQTYKKQVYLFPGRNNKPYCKRAIQKIFEKACKITDIDSKGGIHSLRCSFVAHLRREGYTLKQVKDLIGNISYKTINTYSVKTKMKTKTIKNPISKLTLR